MKSILCLLLLLLSTALQAVEMQENPALKPLFEAAQVQGTFVLHDVASGTFRGHDRQRAQIRFVPASTFKIANSLIGLASGAVGSVDEVFPYDGNPRYLKTWERDMGLREAIKLSNVPVYQELARRVGLPRMQAQVAALGYGNGEVGTVVDRFWLDGPLAISAIEQSQFLARLAQDQLPFAPSVQAQVREISRLEQGPGWTLYGKTGWADAPQPDIGWWVGWLEQDGRLYSFALNIDMTGPHDAEQRVALGKASLRVFGLF